MALDVFISHSRSNAREAKKLADALRAHGLSTWVDAESVAPGQDWSGTIRGALQASRAVVFLIDPTGEPGSALRDEWSEALEAAWAQPDKRLIPLLLGDAQAPVFLRDRRSVRVEDEAHDWERAVQDLVRAVRTEAGARHDAEPPGEEARAEWQRRMHELELAAHALRRRE
jgi:hypothetical protein